MDKFIIIPTEMIQSGKFRHSELIVFGTLLSLCKCGKKDCCYPSDEYLIESLNMTRKTISSALKQLEDFGIISRHRSKPFGKVGSTLRVISINNIEKYL